MNKSDHANKPVKDAVAFDLEKMITEVNDAITEGRNPPKSKKIDVILRVAAALHIFNHVTTDLIEQ